jgi:D-alanyl-D-alanine carboxypeptidase
VQKNDKLGAIKVVLNDQSVGQVDLVALKEDPEGGFIRRWFDALQLMIK